MCRKLVFSAGPSASSGAGFTGDYHERVGAISRIVVLTAERHYDELQSDACKSFFLDDVRIIHLIFRAKRSTTID